MAGPVQRASARALSGHQGHAAVRPGPGPTLTLVLLLAAGLRCGATFTVGDSPALVGDENDYVSAALSLAQGQGYPGSVRPPGFPFVLSVAFRLGGEHLRTARIAQMIVSLLGIAVVFDLVRRAFGARPALVSALVCACHPTLVHYSHFLWAETLYTTLLLAAFWSLQRLDQGGHEAWTAAAGGLLGLAGLTREMALYFVPLALLWLWLLPGVARGARARRLALFALTCAVVVLPWTARNLARHGRFVLVSTTRWLPVAQGNLLPEGDWLYGPISDPHFVARYLAIPDEFERERLARDVAERAVAQQQPLWILRKVVRNTYLLFRPVSQLSRFLREGRLRTAAVPLARRLVVVEWVGYVALTALGLSAVWLVPHARMKWLIAGYLVFSWALFVLANANHRFRVPLLPLLAVYSGPLLCGRIAPPADRRWRVAGAAACLTVFAAVLAAEAGRPRSARPETIESVTAESPVPGLAAPAAAKEKRRWAPSSAPPWSRVEA
jgi:4-amino-4-deoxy-L-arabinose transferase-like glycosyltransferase